MLFLTGMGTKLRPTEARGLKGREQGVGFWGSEPPAHQIGALVSAISSPAESEAELRKI